MNFSWRADGMILFFTRNIKFKTFILILYTLSVPIFPVNSFDLYSTLPIVTGIVLSLVFAVSKF